MTDTSQPISKYVSLKGLSRDSFVTMFPHPFLVELKSNSQSSQDDPVFATLAMSAAEFSATHADGPLDTTVHVQPLTKRTTASFEGMINVGRTPNNDVVLLSRAISKLHAYFTYSRTDNAYFLTDATSTNGTLINGKKLTPKQPERIFDGDTINFAYEFRMLFFSAPSFHDYLTETYT